ncbi:probable H/ACA ribonucleoprotein complex subunit 1 [Macadamia integrifolia]|uniref:probable H/ACA ribonucleoprotein complex subunit 1 n=1 Tax=Macadamia integrifolia TaxID=60698 RepID=UPI001C52DE0E|nr:probable H/ACA ribonucleoprotein complex subunit 1 [Macadamia integrifolia]
MPIEVEGLLGGGFRVIGGGAEGDGGDADGAGGGAGRGAGGVGGGVGRVASGVGGGDGGVPPLDPQTMGSIVVSSSSSTRGARPYGLNDVMACLDTTTNLLRRMDNWLESMDRNNCLLDNRMASLEA